jgi:hypothetical protein
MDAQIGWRISFGLCSPKVAFSDGRGLRRDGVERMKSANSGRKVRVSVSIRKSFVGSFVQVADISNR